MTFGQIKKQYEKIISHNYAKIEICRKLRNKTPENQNQNQWNTMLFPMKRKTYLRLISLLHEIEKSLKICGIHFETLLLMPFLNFHYVLVDLFRLKAWVCSESIEKDFSNSPSISKWWQPQYQFPQAFSNHSATSEG